MRIALVSALLYVLLVLAVITNAAPLKSSLDKNKVARPPKMLLTSPGLPRPRPRPRVPLPPPPLPSPPSPGSSELPQRRPASESPSPTQRRLAPGSRQPETATQVPPLQGHHSPKPVHLHSPHLIREMAMAKGHNTGVVHEVLERIDRV